MSTLILFEDHGYRDFLPLTYWRPVFDLRCGRGRLCDLALAWSGTDGAGLWVRDELRDVVLQRSGAAVNDPAGAGAVLVNGRWLPEGNHEDLPAPSVGLAGSDVAFVLCDEDLARRLTPAVMLDRAALTEALQGVPQAPALGRMVSYPWDLLERNGDRLLIEWQEGDAGLAGEVHDGAHLLNAGHIHVGPGARVDAGAVLDARQGPIFVDRDAHVMPTAVIEGPTCIGRGTVINPGTWIRNRVTIGPGCKVGGEVGMSIFQGRANKQHHGFVGHSCIAEWVNLGAGTTTSNLKNTYGPIAVPLGGVPVDSGSTFMGAIIGDFARTGINQSLTTGCVVGLGSSVVCSGTAPGFVPSFRFMTERRDEPYDPQRCLAVAEKMMSRRDVAMSDAERSYFQRLPDLCRSHEMY